MIEITKDLHTHTTFSHGSGSVEDNVKAAAARGLAAVAICDHGFSHLFYGIRRPEEYLAEIARVRKKYAGTIEVLAGAELNLMSLDGDIDLPPALAARFDVLLLGYHLMANYRGLKNAAHFHIKAKSEKSIPANTNAFIAAIRRHKIDVISHPGYGIPVDKAALAKAAAERGTALEINNKHPEFTNEELRRCAWTGVKFAVCSDAHSPGAVGVFDRAVARAEAAGITAEQIINAKKD